MSNIGSSSSIPYFCASYFRSRRWVSQSWPARTGWGLFNALAWPFWVEVVLAVVVLGSA